MSEETTTEAMGEPCDPSKDYASFVYAFREREGFFPSDRDKRAREFWDWYRTGRRDQREEQKAQGK